jgi:chromosome segregation ATPase
MTQLPSSEDPALEDRKLALEVEKIQAEIAVLRNPYRHPQFWGAVLVAVVSISVAATQFARSNNDYVLAQIKSERLALDSEKLERTRASLEADAKAFKGIVEITRTEMFRAEREFRIAQERLASSRLTRDQLDHEITELRKTAVRARKAADVTDVTLRPGQSVRLMVQGQDGGPTMEMGRMFTQAGGFSIASPPASTPAGPLSETRPEK